MLYNEEFLTSRASGKSFWWTEKEAYQVVYLAQAVAILDDSSICWHAFCDEVFPEVHHLFVARYKGTSFVLKFA